MNSVIHVIENKPIKDGFIAAVHQGGQKSKLDNFRLKKNPRIGDYHVLSRDEQSLGGSLGGLANSTRRASRGEFFSKMMYSFISPG